MAALDAFGRLRTAGCFTTFNYYPSPLSTTLATNLDVDVWVTSGTGGTQTYNSQNYINMPISGGVGTTYSLRTTKQPMIYQPGKSRLFYMTGVLMDTITPNTTSLMGFFDVDSSVLPPVVTQGTYFKCNGTNFYWEDATQNLPITSAVQSSWNIDTFDGNGPSGKTLTVAANANKTFLIVIDQEWLGVGRLRCGFVIDGVIYYAHQFLHNGLTVQYTKTPRISLSYLIYGATTANAMRQMCSTSIIEDGYFSTGRINNVDVPISGLVDVNTTNNRVLLGLKIQSGFPKSTFYLKDLFLYYNGGGTKYAQFKVQMHSANGSIGNVTGALTFNPLPYSSIQYCIGNGTTYVSTEGFVINSGYLDSQTSSTIVSVVNDSLQTRNLFTSWDTLYITGIASADAKMGATVTFIEDI
jgi:hypothetical protein